MKKKIIFSLGISLILFNLLTASDNDFPIGEVEVINAKNISISAQKESSVKKENGLILKQKENVLNKKNTKKEKNVEKEKNASADKLLSKINDKIVKKPIKQKVSSDKKQKDDSLIREENNEKKIKNEVPKIDLKNYVNVKYNKDLEYFSIISHDENSYKKVLKKYNLDNPSILKRYINSFGNYKAIITNALMYDYKYKKPNIAENFYRLFLDLKHGSFFDRKIRLADYLLRTGRPLEIPKILKSGHCIAQIKNMYICFYYLGLAKYFETGNNRNKYLRISSQKIKKAKELYKMK